MTKAITEVVLANMANSYSSRLTQDREMDRVSLERQDTLLVRDQPCSYSRSIREEKHHRHKLQTTAKELVARLILDSNLSTLSLNITLPKERQHTTRNS